MITIALLLLALCVSAMAFWRHRTRKARFDEENRKFREAQKAISEDPWSYANLSRSGPEQGRRVEVYNVEGGDVPLIESSFHKLSDPSVSPETRKARRSESLRKARRHWKWRTRKAYVVHHWKHHSMVYASLLVWIGWAVWLLRSN